MLARVAHELRRGVETHRLRVQDRAGEDGWMPTFHPGRDIDQQCEAGGMAFRKAVIGESLDLLETTFGKIA
ncbi:MAG TPA: hypothetical protein VFS85_12660, partial [Dongiaceae bacterium]|nr:hypothetical protein [Dongiaceae bacterium]